MYSFISNRLIKIEQPTFISPENLNLLIFCYDRVCNYVKFNGNASPIMVDHI